MVTDTPGERRTDLRSLSTRLPTSDLSRPSIVLEPGAASDAPPPVASKKNKDQPRHTSRNSAKGLKRRYKMLARSSRTLARLARPRVSAMKQARFASSDALLDDVSRAVRDTCRKFADEELVPVAAELDQTHRFPQEQVDMLGEMGMMGMVGFGQGGVGRGGEGWGGVGSGGVGCIEREIEEEKNEEREGGAERGRERGREREKELPPNSPPPPAHSSSPRSREDPASTTSSTPSRWRRSAAAARPRASS